MLPCFELSALFLCIYCQKCPSPPGWHPTTLVLARYCTAGVSRLSAISILAVLILCYRVSAALQQQNLKTGIQCFESILVFTFYTIPDSALSLPCLKFVNSFFLFTTAALLKRDWLERKVLNFVPKRPTWKIFSLNIIFGQFNIFKCLK